MEVAGPLGTLRSESETQRKPEVPASPRGEALFRQIPAAHMQKRGGGQDAPKPGPDTSWTSGLFQKQGELVNGGFFPEMV